MPHPNVTTEKIGVTDYFKIRHSSKTYYVIIPKHIINLFGLTTGHYLGITIKEVKKIGTEQDADDQE